MITINWIALSRSNGISDHDGPERAVIPEQPGTRRHVGGRSNSNDPVSSTLGAVRPKHEIRLAKWMLDDLVARGLRDYRVSIIDGAAGLEKAAGTLWPAVPTQAAPCTEYREICGARTRPIRCWRKSPPITPILIYAKTAKGIETRRKSFIRKWRLKCRAVADSRRCAATRSAVSGVLSKDTVSRTCARCRRTGVGSRRSLAERMSSADPGRNGGAGELDRRATSVSLALLWAFAGTVRRFFGGENPGWGERGGLGGLCWITSSRVACDRRSSSLSTAHRAWRIAPSGVA